jgi:hypothetical protein
MNRLGPALVVQATLLLLAAGCCRRSDAGGAGAGAGASAAPGASSAEAVPGVTKQDPGSIPACDHALFTQVTVIPMKTPADYDFPKTQAAVRGVPELKGVRFVEVRRAGVRVLGALVKDRQTALALHKALEGSSFTPHTRCSTVTPTREVFTAS